MNEAAPAGGAAFFVPECVSAKNAFPTVGKPIVSAVVNVAPDNDRRMQRWGPGLIVLGGLLAYINSFSVPFVFDDVPTILENAAIRQLWPLSEVLWPPPAAGGLTLSGRPVFALTLALNYAISGEAVWSYHAVNLLIHVMAGLVLGGLVRRTWIRVKPDASAGLPALAVALIWTLHPLQTESVTYIVQRAECLAGLFYLLTLYSFTRAVAVPHAGGWWVLMLLSCALGMGTKEVMVTAPVMVWFYDRTFVAGSFAGALRQRAWIYAGLAATWLLLLVLIASTGGNRGGTVGFNVGVTPWAYALTQFEAMTRYVGLAVWPRPLVFEYGTFWVTRAGEVLPWVAGVALLLVATLVGLWRRWALGFAGVWFFGMLAPTSLTPGTIQMIVEHRMYLALAAVIALGVVGAVVWLGRWSGWVLAAVALASGVMTNLRNADYRDETALWRDTVAKRPSNALALTNLGRACQRLGKMDEAILFYERATVQNPRSVEARFNLGLALAHGGRWGEAIGAYENARAVAPGRAEIGIALGQALAGLGRIDDAAVELAAASRLAPQAVAPWLELGKIFLDAGRWVEAVAALERARILAPGQAEVHYQLGNALAQTDRLPEALAHYETAVRLRPDYTESRVNWGNCLLQLSRLPEAVGQYEAVLRLKPDHPDAHHNLGMVFLNTGRPAEAVAQFEAALRARPDFPSARARWLEAQAAVQAR